jgi:hypothetical protein
LRALALALARALAALARACRAHCGTRCIVDNSYFILVFNFLEF